jgi:thymidylate synthase (FAD)
MKVSLLATTSAPDHARWIAETAGMCYNKTDKSNKSDEEILEFLKEKWRMKHYSIFEFVDYTFEIEGISRVALAQITRHWNSSFMVKSGRYCKEAAPSFYIPESVKERLHAYPLIMEEGDPDEYRLDADDFTYLCTRVYDHLISKGIKTEDARYLLPQALTTSLRFKFSLKDWLCSIAPQRISSHSQAEIREICKAIHIGLLQHYTSDVMPKFLDWYMAEGRLVVQR